MAFKDFPLEMIALIVEYYRDDKEALKGMSLVSRLFLSVCRTHLFTSIRLNSLNPAFDYKCMVWTSLLENSSEILPYLRSLELGPPVFRLRERDPRLCAKHWDGIQRTGLPSIHDVRVQKLMTGAVNAKTVTLRFEYQSWNKFSTLFKGVVLDLLRHDTVSVMNLEEVIDFPFHELRLCRRLRELSLVCMNLTKVGESSEETSNDKDSPTTNYINALTLFLSDDCIEPLMNALAGPKSHLSLLRLQRLSVNTTGSDGRLALTKIPPLAPLITTLELRIGNLSGYNLCKLDDFPKLRTLLISISYNRHQRPINALAQFMSKATKSSHLEELQILFRHDIQELEREKGSQDLMRLCVNRDWQTLEQQITKGRLFPSLKKMALVFRPKDVTTFINDHLVSSLHMFLLKVMPALYALTNPTIEVFDDRFEQYTTQV